MSAAVTIWVLWLTLTPGRYELAAYRTEAACKAAKPQKHFQQRFCLPTRLRP